ncbi:unnamed protein product [Prunus armeniaca]|uniref:BED-type domain-containing protein n=1 Tax=Prunus armeniaca TaxID=36596 RepID=A0A6J5VRD1_PRUAR|nr:unnamed protein product [Prunus armeniaca]
MALSASSFLMTTPTSTSNENPIGNTSQPQTDTPSTSNGPDTLKPSNAEVLPQETKANDSAPIEEGERKPARPPSIIWEHFIKMQDDPKNPKAKYKYCNKVYACGSKRNGISNLLSHLENQCKEYLG